MTHDRLVVLTRFPAPHASKTRLIPHLGPAGAADLQRRMTAWTLNQARALSLGRGVEIRVRFSGGDAAAMAACFGQDFVYEPQGGGDLGDRLHRAAADAFHEGCTRVVLIGADCPELTPAILSEAFRRLDEHDLVLGPARDGGYYLIGLRAPAPALFSGIAWSTDSVLSQTLQAAESLSLSVSLLAALSDVDVPADLSLCDRILGRPREEPASRRIAIVIPTWNDEPQLRETLQSAAGGQDVEIVVSAAGDSRRSLQIAADCRCQFVNGPAGRAGQLNRGARSSQGEILLFLHADSRLPAGFDVAVRSALDTKGTAGGAFSLGIDAAGWPYRCIERGVSLRSRALQMPYGDQALFLKRDTFERIGGFPELPLMEDFEFVRRLRRAGRIAIVPLKVATSARRWQALGPWKTTWINQCIVAGYCLGVSCDRLARFYRNAR